MTPQGSWTASLVNCAPFSINSRNRSSKILLNTEIISNEIPTGINVKNLNENYKKFKTLKKTLLVNKRVT